jgi:hypothetical protein
MQIISTWHYRPELGSIIIFDLNFYSKDGITLCIFTEYTGNTGRSVTNASEELATYIYNTYKNSYCLIPPYSVIWAERYINMPAPPDISVVTYTWVERPPFKDELTATDAVFHNFARAYVENLIEILKD